MLKQVYFFTAIILLSMNLASDEKKRSQLPVKILEKLQQRGQLNISIYTKHVEFHNVYIEEATVSGVTFPRDYGKLTCKWEEIKEVNVLNALILKNGEVVTYQKPIFEKEGNIIVDLKGIGKVKIPKTRILNKPQIKKTRLPVTVSVIDKEYELNDIKSLNFIDLSSSKINSLKHICQFKSLEYLDLGNTSVVNYDKLFKFEKLKYLNLNNTNINSLESLESLKSLEHLFLVGANYDSLKPLKNLKGLKRLYLSKKITKPIMRELESLKIKLPNLKITQVEAPQKS